MLENLRPALLIGMLHGNNNLGHAWIRDKIHCATESLDFARQHPVSQVAARRDLHSAKDGEIDFARADHAKGLF